MINGVINIAKEAGYTSHDVVARLRGIIGQKKIGHTGTLDPGATGVLPVCLGKATKLCDLIGSWDKAYRTTLLLGRKTDTEDIFGQITGESEVNMEENEIREIIASFVGDYDQIPPMYSAKKVGGKKLYELAREGIEIERKPCRVRIDRIDILDVALPEITMEITCSKGTYIRSLCRDIGEKAGCGGCMSSLVRTRVADFFLEDALTLDQIEKLRDEGKLEDRIRSIDSVFPFCPSIQISPEGRSLLMNGNPLPPEYISLERGPDVPDVDSRNTMADRYRVYDDGGHFIGLYRKTGDQGILKPEKLFFTGI